ncbi:MAG TPA: ribonuclease H-like domain-containing protein [Candidatus Saccharimonadales bacterium]|nr:ribonuclease H-like domain-containing protein [Candidatus Saccharimonadales bacterium]
MALIVDIETVGEDWQKIDETTKSHLLEKAAKRLANDADVEEVVSSELGLSPLTSQIVALGVLDSDTSKGAVYFQAPNQNIPDSVKDGLKYHTGVEKEILTKFWEIAEKYTEFVTYNGRTFDFPFIMIRSAIDGLRAGKDLTRARYLYQQSPQAVHVDLYDQLTFYGAAKVGSLHMVCRAFGIETPKDGEIDGSKVGEYFLAKKYQEIAEYNGRDLTATAELYRRWKKLLSF